jgi:hypothetical protein
MSLVPNTMTVRTEAYPLTRRLYLYVPDRAKPEARAFADFAISVAGQDVVEKAGFVGQKVTVIPCGAPPPDTPDDYTALIPRADRLSVDLRFRPNSSVLHPKGVDDIKRIASAMSTQFADRGIMLMGSRIASGPGNTLSFFPSASGWGSDAAGRHQPRFDYRSQRGFTCRRQ